MRARFFDEAGKPLGETMIDQPLVISERVTLNGSFTVMRIGDLELDAQLNDFVQPVQGAGADSSSSE